MILTFLPQSIFTFAILYSTFHDEKTDELVGIEPDIKEEDDSLFDALRYGASYKRLDEKTKKVIDTKLSLEFKGR